jgi:hypothetical protein
MTGWSVGDGLIPMSTIELCLAASGSLTYGSLLVKGRQRRALANKYQVTNQVLNLLSRREKTHMKRKMKAPLFLEEMSLEDWGLQLLSGAECLEVQTPPGATMLDMASCFAIWGCVVHSLESAGQGIHRATPEGRGLLLCLP